MKVKKLLGMLIAVALIISMFSGCGGQEKTTSTDAPKVEMTDEERIISAADEGKVGNWGLGNEYEIQALLTKYGKSDDYLVQSFDMDGFDDDSITLASAMTYNELGLVVNDYEGGYGYGDTVGTIDMNDQGVAMLEDNIFCTKEFAKNNPNTVKAFLAASLKGWEYACENPEEAAQIVFEAGSSVSTDHQKYMAKEVAKLIKTDTKGNSVSDYGKMDEEAMQQTLDLLNCHFHSPKRCRILTEMLCKSGKCSFCKTTEQVKADLEKYPPCNYAEIYAARHKNDMK